MLPIKKATTVLMLGMSLLLQYGTVSAFQPPKQQQSLVMIRQARRVPLFDITNTKTTDLHLFDTSSASPFFDEVFQHAVSDIRVALFITAGLGITAVVFLAQLLWSLAQGFLLTFLVVGMEKECMALIPDTWVEYKNKLEEGQRMDERPDLIEELHLLLNKCKVDRLEQVCLDAKLAPDLWEKYQNMLDNKQELQDRPGLIAQLDNELSQRAGQVLKENTSVCPAATWTSYEEKAGDDDLIERPSLLEDMAKELGYHDLVGACSACLLKDAAIVVTVEGDAKENATTIS